VSDLDRTLGAQLHRLADEIAPAADPLDQVGAARSRHRRQRRTRAGLAAVAVAVAVIAIGVPTTIGALSSGPAGGVAGPGATAPPAPSGDPGTAAQTEAEAAESAAATGAQAAAGNTQAEAELAEVTARLDSPIALTAPAEFGDCPDGVAALSPEFGTDVTGGDGHLPGGPIGCRWSLRAAMQWNQVSVGIGFLTGTTAAQMQAGVDSPSDGRCTAVDVPAVQAQAALQRCAGEAATEWYLNVPDSSGSGIWVLSAKVGVGAAPPSAGEALAAVAALARTTWAG
jgi:hypothetical protein